LLIQRVGFFTYCNFNEGARKGVLATRPNPEKPGKTRKNPENQIHDGRQKNMKSLMTNIVSVFLGTPRSGV
jgi:hypothetical protein